MKSSPFILPRPLAVPNSIQPAPNSVLVEAKPEDPKRASSSAFQVLTATTTRAFLTPVSLTLTPSMFSPAPPSPALLGELPPTEEEDRARVRPPPRPLALPLNLR